MKQIHILDNSQVRAAIALALGVSQQVMTNWKHRGIPADKCPDIEVATGIQCELLRPDVNWAALRTNPPVIKDTGLTA